MKYIILLSVLFIVSCEVKTKSYTEDKEYSPEIDRKVDSMMDAGFKKEFTDTTGIATAPIEVKKAWFVTKEYSSYKDIKLTFKNVSGKKIEAARFAWYGENAFGEPADMGGLIDGFSTGQMDKPLKSGQIMTLTWNILSRDGKKVIIAYPTEVVFADGTKWKKPD